MAKTTDISSVNASTFSVSVSGSKTKRFRKSDISSYYFEASRSKLVVEFYGSTKISPIGILLSDLRVAGAGSAPVSEAAALTALDAVFLKAISSSGGTGLAATKADADLLPVPDGTFVRVATDENNNNNTSMYLRTAGGLEFQYTIPQ